MQQSSRPIAVGLYARLRHPACKTLDRIALLGLLRLTPRFERFVSGPLRTSSFLANLIHVVRSFSLLEGRGEAS
jgi:hypothetical protein